MSSNLVDWEDIPMWVPSRHVYVSGSNTPHARVLNKCGCLSCNKTSAKSFTDFKRQVFQDSANCLSLHSRWCPQRSGSWPLLGGGTGLLALSLEVGWRGSWALFGVEGLSL